MQTAVPRGPYGQVSPIPLLSLDQQLGSAILGAETPQAPPLTVRQSSPPPAPSRAGPWSSPTRGPLMPDAGLQVQLQAKAQAQIQAYQAMVQAQAQAYAVSQIQPQVQALSHQIQQPAAPVTTAQAYAQILAQQKPMLGQHPSATSLLPRPGDEAHAQMQRQLQEQVMAQVWAQAQVQTQREHPGRPTLVRQQSWARTSLGGRPLQPVASPPPTTSPLIQNSEGRWTSDGGVPAEAVVTARTVVPTKLEEPRRQSDAKPSQPAPREVQVQAEEDQELLPGILVNIDGHKFEIMQPLGMGSYGMVWSAMSEGDIEVAVKEILCRSRGELSIAHFEGNLLERLGRMETGACENGRLPALVAQETQSISSTKSWRVRLAMSRIPGMPLMILLEQHREYKKAQVDPSASSPQSSDPQPFPERPTPRLEGETPFAALLRKLSEPCQFTKELIVQIFPTLERIASVAFHRDINPRNILIDSPTRPGPPNYGLVDFGMAVDAGQWRSDVRGNWNTLEVGGDCRYWPVSAWVMFLHGPHELTPGSPWRVEYQTQLDIHALGITALQVFVELLPSMQDCASGTDDDDDGCLRTENSLLTKLKALADAWAQYWEDAMDFWSCLIDCFTNNGDWNALKRACINHGVQEAITKDLNDLRATLSDAASAFEAASASEAPKLVEASREIQVVFKTVRALISVGDSTHFPTWRSIIKILGLPASMEELSSAPPGVSSAGRGLSNCVSAHKLSATALKSPGRSQYSMIAQSPGPRVNRAISVATDLSGPSPSPATARRQASLRRDPREGVSNGSSTSRMVSVVTSGSPMCSPRRAATVVVDASGRQRVIDPQQSLMREPMTGRRSGTNITASPTGPPRAMMREHSFTCDPSLSRRSKSALVPASPPFGQLPQDLQQKFLQSPVVRRTSGAAPPGSAVVRSASIVTAQSLQESSSSAAVRSSSITNPGQDYANSARGNGLVVMTKNPELSPAHAIRGVNGYGRSPSPTGRGASVVIESSSRGPSLVTAAARGASVAIDAAGPPTGRRPASYAADALGAGPSPAQGVRLLSPQATLLSARQWGPLSSRPSTHDINFNRASGFA